jgi:hypothetical protein
VPRQAAKRKAPSLSRGLPVVRGSKPHLIPAAFLAALASLRGLPEGKLVSGYFFLVVFFAGFFFAGMAFLRIGLDLVVARVVAFFVTGIGPPLELDAAGKAP